MSEPFIYPNWHVLALHFPLGLLGMGVILEWVSLLWPRSAVRIGGRWMILMGALLTIPASTLGAYAFRDVVTPAGTLAVHWKDVVAQSHWSDAQWHYMTRHAWYEAIGTALAVLAVVVYLAGSDEARRKLYWPGLIVVTAALVLMVVGGWYSGESVYRHGTAVAAASPRAPAAEPASATAPELYPTTLEPDTDRQAAATEPVPERGTPRHPAWVMRYLPPVQMHLLSVGATLAFAFAAIGLSIRRWSQTVGPLPASHIPSPPPRVGQPVSEERAADAPAQPVAPAPAVLAPATILYPIFPARFWLAAMIFALLGAVGGLWMTGDWTLRALVEPLQREGTDWRDNRLFWHVVFGLSIVLCTLLLAVTTRVSRRAKAITIILILLLLAAVALQLWIGMLMLYDSPMGPVNGFAA